MQKAFERLPGARPLVRGVASQASADGAGVRIQRVAGFDSPDFSPFLMLDEIRSENADDYIAGFPPHPHRGIETLTYMLNGEFEHRDHLGNHGAVSTGGAQWMRAGRGIIHSEMPTQPEDAAGGGMHGFQLWINMAAANKMDRATWRDIQAAEIPEVVLDREGSLIRLIAGKWTLGGEEKCAPLTEAAAEASVADLRLARGAEVNLPLPAEHCALVFVYRGALVTERGTIQRGNMLLYGAGESLQLRAAHDEKEGEGAGLLCLHGRPLREPVAHYGPFVMNSREEIEQALRDYNNGTLTD